MNSTHTKIPQEMNLSQLRHLIALAECGSFSGAAEAVHLTQSALSRSIQALEEELGLRLIDRIGRRNDLSATGLYVVGRARKIVFDVEELSETAARMKKGLAGKLTIGLGAAPGMLLALPLLERFSKSYPGVKLTLVRSGMLPLLAALRERNVDALVVSLTAMPPAPDLMLEAIGDMRVSFMCRPGHPLLAWNRPVTLEELQRYPVASTPSGDVVTRELTNQYGPQAHPDVLVTLRSDEHDELIEAARRTDAVALTMPALAPDLVELMLSPAYHSIARFGIVTLRGRSEAPGLVIVREMACALIRDI
jgi:DNA-binding transcriptional LysR family regulator